MKEILIDANILLRHFVGDDPEFSNTASYFFDLVEQGQVKCLVSVLTVSETIWIMEKYYRYRRDIYVPLLTKVLALKHVDILEIKKQELITLLEQFAKTSIDFTDHYLAAVANKRPIFTFDKDFKKLKAKPIHAM